MLNKEENRVLESIKTNSYMQKTIALVENFVEIHASDDKKVAYMAVFDEVFRILNEAKSFVDEYLADRKTKGEIKDEKQALKSIAGIPFLQHWFIFS